MSRPQRSRIRGREPCGRSLPDFAFARRCADNRKRKYEREYERNYEREYERNHERQYTLHLPHRSDDSVEFSIKNVQPGRSKTDCVIVGVFEGRKLSAPAAQLDTQGYLS